MIDPSLFVLLSVLAVYRVTRLLIVDKILEVPREKVQNFFEDRWIRKHEIEDPDTWRSSIAYLLGCMWCASIWVSCALYLVFWASIGQYPVWFFIVCVSVASAITGLIHTWENRANE